MSRAEREADSHARTVRYSRRVVERALETGHVGEANAIRGSELASFVPIAETTVRDVIAELRDDPHGPPIGVCPTGYYVINTPAELDRYVEAVHDEIETKRDRLAATVRSYNQRHL